jgi:hypothetical protein
MSYTYHIHVQIQVPFDIGREPAYKTEDESSDHMMGCHIVSI